MRRPCANHPGVPGRRALCICEPPPILCDPCMLVHRCPGLDLPRPKATSERAGITSPLKSALETRGCIVYRMQSGSGSWRMAGNKKGTLDLLVLPPLSPPVTWSVAALEGKGSHPDGCTCESCKAQRDTRTELERRGVLCIQVRSVDEGLRGLGLA